MRQVIWLAVFWVLSALPAHAGAWLREEGTSFLALSYNLHYNLENTNTAYFEYGLRPELTLGAKIDMYVPAPNVVLGTGLVFIRKPLSWTYGKGVWAYELGIGVDFNGFTYAPLYKAGLSYGRGLSWKDRGGWLAIDSALEWNTNSQTRDLKIDTTLGLNIGARSKAMLQVFTTLNSDFNKISLGPSYIYDLKPRGPKKRVTSLVVGFEADTLTPDNPQIKFGLWQSF